MALNSIFTCRRAFYTAVIHIYLSLTFQASEAFISNTDQQKADNYSQMRINF